MSEETEESDEEELPAKRWLPWVAGVLSIFLLYVLSWGPAIFMWVKNQNDLPDSVENVLMVTYRPRLVVMYHSEAYFYYSMWWAKKADPAVGLVTYKEFR